MKTRRFAYIAFAFLCLGLLAGCKSAEEKAEEHYQSALQLVEQGDPDRALVELRNVFKLDGKHKEARIAYARIEQERGNQQQAYGNYLRLVEQYPDNLIGYRELSRMALLADDWAEVERHMKGAQTAGLVETDPTLRAVQVNLDFRIAVMDKSDSDRATATRKARELISKGEAPELARRVVIADLVLSQDWEDALQMVDDGLKDNEDDRYLNRIRLGLLEKLERYDDIEVQLRSMIDRFPDDQDAFQGLMRLYLSRNKIDEAEAFLRGRIDPTSEDARPSLQLVQFLNRYRSIDDALSQLDGFVQANDSNQDLYRAMRAGLKFDAGEHDTAIAEMEEVVKNADATEEGRRFKVSLARMYITTGNSVGARVLVEEVLEEDATEIEALKLKAGWLIEDDEPGDALVELNSALDQAPRDPGILTLMAHAHQRAGNFELVGDMLSRAADASGNAPAEALRYAEHLIKNDQLLPAESVLVDALRKRPDNIQILTVLGNVYVRLDDAPRLQSVIKSLERIDTPQSRNVAKGLTARLLAQQNRDAELSAFLENLAESEDGNLRTHIAVIRQRLANEDIEGARKYIQKLRQDGPDTAVLRFIEAGVLATTGDPEASEGIYRALLAEDPKSEATWVALYNLTMGRGEVDAAMTVLEEGISELPSSGNLRWAKAGQLEATGRIEKAIEIYEDLYEENSDSTVIANNLASLISSYRDTPEALERSYKIARRLRGTDVPQFQDTYGWIASRLGNYDEALEYLVPAAEALPDEAIIQYHLAETYAKTGQDREALELYKRIVELVADDIYAPPYIDRVTAEIERLEASGNPLEAEAETQPDESQ